jgi:asparaginyl-tRNA synthetase
MSDQVFIANFKDHIGKEVTVKGWLYNQRSKGKIQFLQVRDGSGIVQAVLGKGDVPDDLFARCDHLPQESSIVVRGVVREDKRAPGGYEMSVKHVEIVQESQPYPIALKEHGVDFLLEHRHLWLRSRKTHAILRIRARIIKAIRDFLDNDGFVLIDAPIFTPAACEGTTTLFAVDYFDEKAYLSQSGQLYMEAAAMAFGKVYCFGPAFRAEKSKTRRHLMEFWMVEPEIAYGTLEDVMQCEERMICYIVACVLKDCRKDLEVLERDIAKLEKIKAPFPRISYDESLKILAEKGNALPWGQDFGAPHEEILCNMHDNPLFVTRFPAAFKAFYMKPDPSDEKYVLGADLLAPEGYGEIIGGGQREDSLERLEKKIAENKLPSEAFSWYLDLRRYGSVPHAGFGIGVERTTTWICGIHHIRETIPFPRMLERIYP